jgi:hypothetical protein
VKELTLEPWVPAGGCRFISSWAINLRLNSVSFSSLSLKIEQFFSEPVPVETRMSLHFSAISSESTL